jgi:hypothetical protein
MSLTPESLRKLRKRLPKAAVPRVVEQLNAQGLRFTEKYLYMNLSGKRYNHQVMLALIEYAEKHEREQRQLNDRAAGISN